LKLQSQAKPEAGCEITCEISDQGSSDNHWVFQVPSVAPHPTAPTADNGFSVLLRRDLFENDHHETVLIREEHLPPVLPDNLLASECSCARLSSMRLDATEESWDPPGLSWTALLSRLTGPCPASNLLLHRRLEPVVLGWEVRAV
jgi:hypothetical protein